MSKERVIVITGATSGIGEATAKAFADENSIIILVGRNDLKGNEIVKNIEQNKGHALFLKCDVAVEEQVSQLFKLIKDKFDHIDVLFNNAGIMLSPAEIEKTLSEDWNSTFNVNVNGLFYVTKYLKEMITKCHGTIINNASIAGLQSYITGRSYAYSASKAAVIQFSRQMAKNYAKDGVRVNCICPGIIDTPILGERDRKIYAERVPLGYIGKPKDVARVVLFLASDAAAYITGVVLPIDGGVSL